MGYWFGVLNQVESKFYKKKAIRLVTNSAYTLTQHHYL